MSTATLSDKISLIASGTSLSAAVPLDGGMPAALSIPAGWTAAALTFQASIDGGLTFFDFYDKAGVEYAVSATANRAFILPLNDLAGLTHIKLRSGTTATPVVQAADRVITLGLRMVSR